MRTIWILTAFGTLAAATLQAQDTNPQATRTASFSIRGVIVDSEGAPLLGAEVYTPAGERAISDASGEFILSNLTNRSVSLLVRRIGYAPVSLALDADVRA
jgi:hypothetical protein